jgi:serine/threonine protein kinase
MLSRPGIDPSAPACINGELFYVENNYEPIDYLGSGAYGVVCSAIDRNTKKHVAIKKCKVRVIYI